MRTYDKDSDEYHFYKTMYKNQTLEFATNKKEEYSKLNKCKMTMGEALSLLDTFVDPSDPDLQSVPNSVHAYQTAEMIRRRYPEDIELQLCGLIHDLGKVLFRYNEPEWAIVGDTYVLGAKYSDKMVCYDSIEENKESKLGVYDYKCGIDKLTLSFGHDEYLYMVLNGNKEKHELSEKYMNIIRYHSFYPWHSMCEYRYFMRPRDYLTLLDVKKFNGFDLYSKDPEGIVFGKVKEYYKYLLQTYFPEPLNW
jgi:inositol oxygenase